MAPNAPTSNVQGENKNSGGTVIFNEKGRVFTEKCCTITMTYLESRHPKVDNFDDTPVTFTCFFRTTSPAPKVVSKLSSLSILKSSSNSPWSSKTHLSEHQLELQLNFGRLDWCDCHLVPFSQSECAFLSNTPNLYS